MGEAPSSKSVSAARKDIEASLGCRVHLFIRVKAHPNWMKDRRRLAAIGLEPSEAA